MTPDREAKSQAGRAKLKSAAFGALLALFILGALGLVDRIDRNTGAIAFWYELQRHDKALEDASRAVIDKIRAEAGATVVFGKPE